MEKIRISRRVFLGSAVLASALLFAGWSTKATSVQTVNTTGHFEFTVGMNDDGSAQMSLLGDLVSRSSTGTKTKDSFCRSGGTMPQFPNPVPAQNVPGMQARANQLKQELTVMGFLPWAFSSDTRTLTAAEQGDFRATVFNCLSDMIGISNTAVVP